MQTSNCQLINAVDDFNTTMCQPMTTKRQREIVIEFEQVKMIRKRAKTELHHCDSCGRLVDFVSLQTAATLFEIGKDKLAEFVYERGIHIEIAVGDGSVCVTSLLETMQTQKQLQADGNNSLLRS